MKHRHNGKSLFFACPPSGAAQDLQHEKTKPDKSDIGNMHYKDQTLVPVTVSCFDGGCCKEQGKG